MDADRLDAFRIPITRVAEALVLERTHAPNVIVVDGMVRKPTTLTVAQLAALLTAFYMSRQVFMVFSPKGGVGKTTIAPLVKRFLAAVRRGRSGLRHAYRRKTHGRKTEHTAS